MNQTLCTKCNIRPRKSDHGNCDLCVECSKENKREKHLMWKKNGPTHSTKCQYEGCNVVIPIKPGAGKPKKWCDDCRVKVMKKNNANYHRVHRAEHNLLNATPIRHLRTKYVDEPSVQPIESLTATLPEDFMSLDPREEGLYPRKAVERKLGDMRRFRERKVYLVC